MVIPGIYAAASALRLAGRRVNQTVYNLANASTTAFVPRRAEQAEMAGGGVQAVGTTPLGAGPIVPTERALDLAIDGPGFFVLNDGSGGQLYTRAGNFVINAEGQMVDALGRSLVPPIEIPPEATSIRVTPTGQVQALAQDGSVLAQGQIQTAVFGNTAGLEPVGGNAFRATQTSGPPVTARPATPGHGRLVSGALQASGTDIAREVVNLTLDQRTFEANLRSVQTFDDMLGSVLDLKA